MTTEQSYHDEEVLDDASNENLDDSDVVYQINTYGADFDVDGLVKRFDRGDIYRPHFQRQYVWSHPAASKFVESILLGLPIPSVFLYKDEETQKLLIVDGLQRLTTLHSFVKGRLPNNDRVFKLIKVKDRFENRTYDTLESEDKRRFDDAIIHAMIIQQTSPSNDNSAVFHIFDRLNSNGTPLQPQEMRAAVYNGPLIELLFDLNESEQWRRIFGKIHKRSKDQELILRFLTMYYEHNNYAGPVSQFLNTFTEKHRKLNTTISRDFASLFTITVDRVLEALGDFPFRPSKALNVAYFDSFMVAVAKHPNATKEDIKEAYAKISKNDDYLTSINDSTSGKKALMPGSDLLKRAFIDFTNSLRKRSDC